MYEKEFPARLIALREQKGVSAREMSLSIGQNPGYINNIESGKSLPSMSGFFFICEYLEITPLEFFDFEYNSPQKTDYLMKYLKQLNQSQLDALTTIAKDLSHSSKKQ